MKGEGVSGFTLVELVLALALGAMLMAALVGVLSSVDRELARTKQEVANQWESSVVRVLRRDLLLASTISSSDGWIWLGGDFPDYVRGGKVKQVGYRCVPWIDGRSTLLRLADGRGEPLAIGPRRIVIERLDVSNSPQPLSPRPTTIPNRVRVWIWSGVGERAVVEVDVVLS